MTTSTATITLGGSPTTPQPQQQQQQSPAIHQQPSQQDQGRRRRQRTNVPAHMRPTSGGASPTTYGAPMSFGTVYTAKKPVQQTSTPAANFQTQSLFKEQPQKQADVQIIQQPYVPGPKELSSVDAQRAEEARAKLKEMNLSEELIQQYRRRFNVLDLNKDGVVNLREFAAISRVLGYKFTKEEIMDIFGRKDVDDSGGISFDEFVLAMYERNQKAKELAPYRHLFRIYDWKDHGYITSDDAYPVLKKELGFDENKTEMLIDLYDRNRDYRLSLLEFIPFHKRVEELKVQVHNAFRDFDRDGDGFVSAAEAKAVLMPKGFSDQQVEALIFKYDKDADGRLNFPEFAAFWDVQLV